METEHEKLFNAIKIRIETLRQRKENIKIELAKLNDELVSSDVEIRDLRVKLPELELKVIAEQQNFKNVEKVRKFKEQIASANSLEEIDSIVWRLISN